MNDKISCICVTRNRVPLLQRAVACFSNQTYINKELVITYREDDHETENALSKMDGKNIVAIKYNRSENLTLGAIRNRAIKESSGDYFCTWDDDDWYHRDRLQYQMDAIVYNKKHVTLLFTVILFDYESKKAYLSHARPWENTMLCHKHLLESTGLWYSSLDKGEDKELVMQLVSMGVVAPLSNPRLYLYARTGNNTSGQEHFLDMFSHGIELGAFQSQTIAKIFTGTLFDDQAANILDSAEFLSTVPLIPRLFGY